MAHRLGHHAVVIGGSLAGLMTAWGLIEHFDAVTILARDALDAQRGRHPSIPQGHPLHGLRQRWRWLAIALVTALAAGLLGFLSAPSARAAVGDRPVITYNMFGAGGGSRWSTDVQRLTLGADVVALQEAGAGSDLPGTF